MTAAESEVRALVAQGVETEAALVLGAQHRATVGTAYPHVAWVEWLRTHGVPDGDVWGPKVTVQAAHARVLRLLDEAPDEPLVNAAREELELYLREVQTHLWTCTRALRHLEGDVHAKAAEHTPIPALFDTDRVTWRLVATHLHQARAFPSFAHQLQALAQRMPHWGVAVSLGRALRFVQVAVGEPIKGLLARLPVSPEPRPPMGQRRRARRTQPYHALGRLTAQWAQRQLTWKQERAAFDAWLDRCVHRAAQVRERRHAEMARAPQVQQLEQVREGLAHIQARVREAGLPAVDLDNWSDVFQREHVRHVPVREAAGLLLRKVRATGTGLDELLRELLAQRAADLEAHIADEDRGDSFFRALTRYVHLARLEAVAQAVQDVLAPLTTEDTEAVAAARHSTQNLSALTQQVVQATAAAEADLRRHQEHIAREMLCLAWHRHLWEAVAENDQQPHPLSPDQLVAGFVAPSFDATEAASQELLGVAKSQCDAVLEAVSADVPTAPPLLLQVLDQTLQALGAEVRVRSHPSALLRATHEDPWNTDSCVPPCRPSVAPGTQVGAEVAAEVAKAWAQVGQAVVAVVGPRLYALLAGLDQVERGTHWRAVWRDSLGTVQELERHLRAGPLTEKAVDRFLLGVPEVLALEAELREA